MCFKQTLRSDFTCKLFFNSRVLKGFWCLVRFTKLTSSQMKLQSRLWRVCDFYQEFFLMLPPTFAQHIFLMEQDTLTKARFVPALKLKVFGWRKKGDKTETFWQEHAEVLGSESSWGGWEPSRKASVVMCSTLQEIHSHKLNYSNPSFVTASEITCNQTFSIVSRKLLIWLSILIRSIYYGRSFVDSQRKEVEKEIRKSFQQRKRTNKKLLTGEFFIQNKRLSAEVISRENEEMESVERTIMNEIRGCCKLLTAKW